LGNRPSISEQSRRMQLKEEEGEEKNVNGPSKIVDRVACLPAATRNI
jgi:hypothetical protein